MRFVQEGVLWLGLGGSACLATSACEFPLSSSKYRLAGGGGDTAGALGEGGALGADPFVARLVSAFAGVDSACAAEFAEMCAAPLQACAGSPACVEFAECVRERASPAAETICTDELATPLNDHWGFELARHCWVERHESCTIGQDFSCLAGYDLPASTRTEVTVSQQVLTVGQGGEEPLFTVSFCSGIGACAQPDFQVSPDSETGIYELSLDVGGKNFGIGNIWEGYRVVEGPSIYASVVAANVPIWGRRVEITRLLGREDLDALSASFKGDATNAAFLQIVDCQSEPAPGVSFELPTSADALVFYVKDFATPVSGPTVSTGAAAAYGHQTDRRQEIHARLGEQLVAVWQGWVAAGRPLYLRMHPNVTW